MSQTGSRWMARASRAAVSWGPVAAYLAAITVVSHRPALPLPAMVPDWVLHGIEFFGLGLLVARGLGRSGLGGVSYAALGGLVACAATGALDEWHQSFVPGREASVLDWAADVVGAVLGLGAGVLIWGRATGSPRPYVELVLLGRRDCHLCEQAELDLARVLPEFDARIRKVDVDEDPEMKRLYGDQLPVGLIDGRKVFKVRVDADRLRRVLEGLRSRRTA